MARAAATALHRFIPFPTSVIGEHVGAPGAQQFYFGTIVVTGLVMVALWQYMHSGRPLIHPDLSRQFIRRTDRISLALPTIFLVLMVLVAVVIGKIINPLLLSYLVSLFFIALRILEWRNSEPVEEAEPENAPTEERKEDLDSSGE